MCGSPLTVREYIDACIRVCVSLLQPPSLLSGRDFMCSLLPANVYLLCISGSLLCVSYSTAVVMLYNRSTSVLVWAGVAVGWLICSLLPSLLPLYVSSGKSLRGRAGCRSLMPFPNCVFSAGRCVFWCPLAGAESDFCGRNGLWKGLIFRHNRVFVQNQGAVLKKSSFRGVHPGDVPSRQG